MAGARFCWRERTERINWRMLRGLRLDDVLRRGDATLLEPYALHLTFARLPEVVAALSPSRHDDVGEGDARGDARNAWFIVRAMQLAMEYLLFLRVRDGAVVDSLRDELMACEKDCELLGERAKKWKERSRSGEKQADKLHQVLQGIAKLLQIEGATPSAVSTIESLLSDLVVSRRKHGDGDIGGRVIAPKQIQEARVCTLCGKMFSSNEYLEKHAIRRHPGREVQHLTPIKSSAQQPQEPSEVPGLDNQNNKRTSSSALELKQMLCAVEEMLQEHQETLRNVAREETGRIQNIYEQLHVETQLVEEMRAKRVAIEEEVMKHRHELEAIVQKKEAVIEELSVLNEQFEFLEQKKIIEVQGGGGHSKSLVEVDTSLHLELRRLEETITVLKDALATARDELTRLQDIYALLLKEKQALETQVHESRNHAQRLEATLRQQEEIVPVMKRDVGIQSTAEVATAAAQTTDLPDPSLQESPLILPPTHSVAGEVGVQTEHVDQVANLMDTMIQTDPVVETTPMADTRSTRDVGVDTEVIQDIQAEGYSGSPDANSIFTRHCSFVADEIERRAVRYAHGRTSELSKLMDFQSDKRFVSFPRRKFIRSRFLHDEHSVKSEIATRVAKLEHAMQRYGVQPKSSVLANEHVEVVQRAVHAHLEVLPAEALQKMVDIETMVNNLIKTEWMPQEKCRQEALESLTATLEMKSQRNQGLVRQAMAGFTTAPMVREETSSLQSSSAGPARYASVEATQPVDSVLTTAKSESSSPITLASDLNAKTEIGTNSFAVGQAVQNATSIVLRGGDPDTVPPLPVIFEEQQQIIEERSPSPKSVQAIRKQTEGVRSVKVVSMSPNTSPPRHVNSSPRRAELQGQDANAGHSVDSNEVLPQPVNDISGSTTHGENELADLTERRHSSSHPSSFSAKHPESQLGIIIPSRYEAAQTRDYAPDRGDGEFSPSGLGDETDRGSSSNYSQIASSHDLRWSGSAGQSERVSEQSFSVVASSEVSLNASIPSLVSDGATSERGGEASKETIPHQQHAGESLHAESDEDASTGNRREALQEIIITNAIDFSEPNSQMTHDDLLPSEEAEETQPTVTNVTMENDVVAFDDSDIEEVLLV